MTIYITGPNFIYFFLNQIPKHDQHNSGVVILKNRQQKQKNRQQTTKNANPQPHNLAQSNVKYFVLETLGYTKYMKGIKHI